MNDSNMTPQEMMKTLEKKEGEEFDTAFLEHMTMHHRSGVEMAHLAAQKASRSDIKDMSNRMVKEQEEEIREMEEMMA